MLKKLPLVISALVFTAALITSLAFFHADTGCNDIIGDGYAMGTDPEPVVIGQICNPPWQLATDANNFTTHAILSVLAALPLGVVTWGIVWIACWKNTTIPKKLGISLLMLVLACIGYVLMMVTVQALTSGAIDISQTNGMVLALLSLLLSVTGSLLAMRAIFRRKSKAKNPKRAH